MKAEQGRTVVTIGRGGGEKKEQVQDDRKEEEEYLGKNPDAGDRTTDGLKGQISPRNLCHWHIWRGTGGKLGWDRKGKHILGSKRVNSNELNHDSLKSTGKEDVWMVEKAKYTGSEIGFEMSQKREGGDPSGPRTGGREKGKKRGRGTKTERV